VVVRAGPNGKSLQEIASFPRADFPGDPKLLRVGKMNLKAQAKDHSGEAGAVGEGRILEINPAPAGKTSFGFQGPANRAVVSELPMAPRCPQPFRAHRSRHRLRPVVVAGRGPRLG